MDWKVYLISGIIVNERKKPDQTNDLGLFDYILGIFLC